MQNGIETNCAPEIEQLAQDSIAEASIAVPDAGMAAEANPAIGADCERSIDTGFCRAVIKTFLEQHAKTVHKTFCGKIEPVAGSSIATRIADRAAMAPVLQDQIASDATAVLDKYGLAKFINAEASLIAGLATYYFEYSAAKADLEKILTPPQSQAQSAQPSQ